MGRHKYKFTDGQIVEMEEMALQGCQNGTIASKMGLDRELIHQRKDILTILSKKRAERKLNLRTAQTEKAIKSKDAALLIFLGKNELDQTDKQVVETQSLSPAPLTADEVAELKRMAMLATNLKLRKGA